jgi:hypothetical protein
MEELRRRIQLSLSEITGLLAGLNGWKSSSSNLYVQAATFDQRLANDTEGVRRKRHREQRAREKCRRDT